MKLAAFKAWTGAPTTESRRAVARQMMDTGEAATEEILKGFDEILAAEGPMLSNRLFNLYSKWGGLSKLTPQAKKRFSQALKEGGLKGRFGFEQDPGHDGVVVLIWAKKTDKVVAREIGNRSLQDVPMSELEQVLFDLAAETGAEEEVPLFKEAQKLYGLNRLSEPAENRLRLAYDRSVGKLLS